MSTGKWRPLCLGLNVLTGCECYYHITFITLYITTAIESYDQTAEGRT